VRLRIRNPYPPYPPAPEGVPNAYWTADLASYQTVVRYLLNSLRDDLVRAKVPEETLPSSSAILNATDNITLSLARVKGKTEPFWSTVSPEQFADDALRVIFPSVEGNKRAQREIEHTARLLADNIRDGLVAAGRTPVEPSRVVPAPAVAEEAPAPKSRKPKRAAPAVAEVPPPEKLKVTPEVRAEIEEQIEAVAETLVPPAEPPAAEASPQKPAKRRPPPARRASAGRASGRRASGRMRDVDEDAEPPSLRVEGIPRVKALSEATLRAEREYFYEDDDAVASRGCPQDRRMRGFWPYLAGMRPTYRPPAATLVKHKDDILLMVIPPGNVVQVFTKGQVTEVFASSRTENALHIAARYANQWRGVNDDGDVLRDAKRSRLKTGIYAAYYTGKGAISDIVQLAEPVLEVMERDPEMSGRRVSNPAPRGGLPEPRAGYAPVGSTRRSEMRTRDLGRSSGSLIIRIRNPRR
jgi:hypothetical protein